MAKVSSARGENTWGSQKTCFIVRHGERLDEVSKTDKWFKKNLHRYPLDPPLTQRGSAMAQESAKAFLKTHKIELENLDLKCIYTTPLHRTIKTAYEFAKILKLPIVLVPGLLCTEAMRSYGPICIQKDGLMTMTKPVIYPGYPKTPNVLMTLEEIQEIVPDVKISMRKDLMGGVDIKDYEDVIFKLASECEGPAFLVVNHREGIRHFQGYFSESWRPKYCQTVKLVLNTINKGVISIEKEYEGTPRKNGW